MRKTVKILIAGDTHLGGGRVKYLALSNSKEELFGSFLNRIQDANLSITNLESPLIDNGTPTPKIGPNLKSPVKTLPVLKNAGFNLLTLANNHIMDFGEEGLKSTLEVCVDAGIDTVGAGNSLNEARQPLICKIHGVNIGVINIAENEFGTTKDEVSGASPLNPVQNYYWIKETCKTVDYLIVIAHGGHEHYPLPSPRMKETYRFFVDAGASVVVGHHPHCYSGYEVYKEAPIFYSLGNFLFDDGDVTHSGWNEGFMVELLIGERLSFDVIPYIQNSERAGLRALQDNESAQFSKNIAELSAIILNDKKLEKRFEEFCESSRNLYSAFIEPYSLRYLHALRNRNLFPSLLSKRKKRLLQNLTRCEAHRDVLQKILKQ